MHIWDYRITNKKIVPIQWKLERLINYGLKDKKIDAKELKANWNMLKIDSNKRKFLELLLWPKKF